MSKIGMIPELTDLLLNTELRDYFQQADVIALSAKRQKD